MSIPGALAFSIYGDWFNVHEKSTWLASIATIMLICLNLPPSERLKLDIVYVAGIIPGMRKLTALQLNYLSPGQISRQSLVIDFTSHRASRQRCGIPYH
ncbi:hypothetical protein O181_086405 [Austropuccinia psidii MF-1]|uniref:Uncharacterized protein n=1 Tax=Austropuccinia psidii MF-1 TaxID=1389203 RepID=A0A9Q3FU59_9BASI|nr:hypothetical protein [Austropuccinia psidii MF-1]